MSIKHVHRAVLRLGQGLHEALHGSRRPSTMRPGAPAYRGWHINNIEKCVGCGTCHDICQNEAIDMVESSDEPVRATPVSGRASTTAAAAGARSVWTSARRARSGMSNEYVWVDGDAGRLPLHARRRREAVGRQRRGLAARRTGSHRSIRTASRCRMLDAGPSASRPGPRSSSATPRRRRGARRPGASSAACASRPVRRRMHIPDYIAAIRDGDDAERRAHHLRQQPDAGDVRQGLHARAARTSAASVSRARPIAIRWLKRYATERFDDLKTVIEPALRRRQGALGRDRRRRPVRVHGRVLPRAPRVRGDDLRAAAATRRRDVLRYPEVPVPDPVARQAGAAARGRGRPHPHATIASRAEEFERTDARSTSRSSSAPVS